ncbi:hypothetical protein HN011_009540 [Eciton burchellii]|nr:hypothetical protein HN011_009540 [Eciton burchellii]
MFEFTVSRDACPQPRVIWKCAYPEECIQDNAKIHRALFGHTRRGLTSVTQACNAMTSIPSLGAILLDVALLLNESASRNITVHVDTRLRNRRAWFQALWSTRGMIITTRLR